MSERVESQFVAYVEGMYPLEKVSIEDRVKALIGYLATRDLGVLLQPIPSEVNRQIHAEGLNRLSTGRDFSAEDASQALRPLLERMIHEWVERSRIQGETAVVEGFRQPFEALIHTQLASFESQLTSMRNSQEKLTSDLRTHSDVVVSTAAELHTYLWIASTGADFSKMRVTRYVPVRVYVGDPIPNAQVLDGIVAAIERFAGAIELDKAEELPDEGGSWWKRLGVVRK